VWIRRGLEDARIVDLHRFHRAFYHPENSLLVIVGSFRRDEALRLAGKHLGSLQLAATAPPQPPPWTQIKKDLTVQWDSKVRAVCIGFPPPENIKERIALSLWGNLLWQKLMTDEQIQKAADAVLCTNQLWSAETLPFFIYATAKGKVELSALQGLLQDRLKSFTAAKPGEADMSRFRAMAVELIRSPQLSWDAINLQAGQLSSQAGLPRNRATWMVMGNMAIQLGVRELLLGSAPLHLIQTLQTLTADELHQLLQQTLTSTKQFVTVLTPVKSNP
jgi:predicted Zn-dependent peptidase